MKEHHKKILKTAHYYTLGEPTGKVRNFWIVAHGYGQAADHFIRKFEGIVSEQTFVLAPEGLSRFYWGGNDGRVVSSWMTRKDRLDEIADYANFIQALYEEYVALLAPDAQVVLFGFSQGVATQFRWVMEKFPRFDHLILWGGFVPEDLDYTPHQSYFSDKHLTFVYGDKDEYLTPDRIEWHARLISRQKLEIDTRVFSGKHRVDKTILSELAEDKKLC